MIFNSLIWEVTGKSTCEGVGTGHEPGMQTFGLVFVPLVSEETQVS